MSAIWKQVKEQPRYGMFLDPVLFLMQIHPFLKSENDPIVQKEAAGITVMYTSKKHFNEI